MNKRTKHIMNEKDEIRRVDKEIRKNEGYATGGMLAKTGGSNAPMDAKGKKMMKGGKVKKMNMGGRAMADRAGAQAMDPRMAMAMEAQQKRAAMGGMMKGGKVKKHAKAVKKATRKSAQGKASKRADGIAQRGRTKGRIV